jgi:hypothetical protein
MQWNNKEVVALTDDELRKAKSSVDKVSNDRNSIARNDARFAKKFPSGTLPPANSVFLAIQQEINDEIKKRGLWL